MSLSINSKTNIGSSSYPNFLSIYVYPERDWSTLDDRFAILIGTLNPELYGDASTILASYRSTIESYTTSGTSTKTAYITNELTSTYGADYSYGDNFEEAGVTIGSTTTVVDVVADEYTITKVEAYDDLGNELTVTTDGQTVTINDSNYISGDVITIKIYISLNSEVITNFDDFLNTNEGNATLYNSVEELEISVESPKLLPNTSDYTVKYIDLYTNEEILTTKLEENIAVNTQISAEKEIIEIEGYTYIKTSTDTLTVASDEDENVIIIYYSYNSEVIVQYIDKATTGIIYTYTLEGLEGDSYSVVYEEQEGYILDERHYPDNEEGTYTKETIYVIYYLEKPVEITITKVSSETSTDEGGTTVYTYLGGVEFSLYMLICEDETHEHDTDLIDTENDDTTCWELIGTYVTEEDGIMTLSNLPITGIYRLVETKTVEDYVLPLGQWKIEFEYNDNLSGTTYTIDGVELQVTGINNPPALSLIDDTLYLYNTESYNIPTTGILGFDDFWKIGVPIILIGMVIYPFKNRRKVTRSKFKSTRESVNNARHIINNWDKRK